MYVQYNSPQPLSYGSGRNWVISENKFPTIEDSNNCINGSLVLQISDKDKDMCLRWILFQV